MNKNCILVLAPHTDDAEFGCGGTIAKLLDEGKDVYCVAFSICKESVPPGFPSDILKSELLKSMLSFGIQSDRVFVLDYPVRRFNEHRQDILEDMIRIRKAIEPSVVFAPSVHDIHQDHNTIAEEAMRAFKQRTLFAYEVPWNHFTFNNQAFFKLEKSHVDRKIRAISNYETQKFRSYSGPEVICSQARARGAQIGCEYAEVFEVVRAIF